jgi:hypothetical protein
MLCHREDFGRFGPAGNTLLCFRRPRTGFWRWDWLATPASPGKLEVQYVRAGDKTHSDSSSDGLHGKVRRNMVPQH